MIRWNAIFTRLMGLMDMQNAAYFSGGRFLGRMKDFDDNLPDYSQLINERRAQGKSTSRRDYFRDILLGLDEDTRVRAMTAILGEIEGVDGTATELSEIRKMLGGGTVAPSAKIPDAAWNADRLNQYLATIDAAITKGEYERAVTLSYTCLEGFLGAFVRAKSKRDSYPYEITDLSKEVKVFVKRSCNTCPDEIANTITQTAYAVNKARNKFSESHFANQAGSWLATYVRDLVNTQIRLLLHFM